MAFKKIDINKILIFFLFFHIVVWTLVPSFTNNNLPLDTIEALAWGNDLQLGYEKHPPLSAWFVELFYQMFGKQDWAYYFLSQIFVVLSFIIIFNFSKDFFKNKILSLVSILLLEGIYFYNYTTPEFNVNVCQLPFWALSVYYCWKGIKHNNITNWLLFGFFAALGVLSKYLFIYLLIAMDIFFIYLIINKKINFKCLISLVSFFAVLAPHLMWLVDNNFTTINYAIFRSVDDPLSGFKSLEFLNHIIYPIIFLGKQIAILIPFLIMLYFIITKVKMKFNFKDEKLLFLISITVLPIFLIFLTSLFTGARIRTMGMSPFYLFIGVFFVYIYQAKINLSKFKNLFFIFLFILFLSPITYYLTSISEKNERTDYPGRQIAQKVQTEWDKNFTNKIEIVVGYGWIDGWYAQNLSYHLKSRPQWKMEADKEVNTGIVLIKDFNTLQDCDGILYQIQFLNDICMIGDK